MIAVRCLRNIHAAWIPSEVLAQEPSCHAPRVKATWCRRPVARKPTTRPDLTTAPYRMAREASHLEGECTPPLERALERPDYHVHRLAEQDFLRMETAYWYHECAPRPAEQAHGPGVS